MNSVPSGDTANEFKTSDSEKPKLLFILMSSVPSRFIFQTSLRNPGVFTRWLYAMEFPPTMTGALNIKF